MGLPLVLRLPRLERNSDPEFVLLHVSQAGTSPLDLKLVATESSEVFTVSIKHNKTSSLQAKNARNSAEEWDRVLSTILLGEAPAEGNDESLGGIEAVTEVAEGKSLTIIIQKRIEGITQRLGQIILQVTEDEELDLYEWCSLTIGAQSTLKRDITTIQSTIKSKDDEIHRLESALAELTTLKNQHEAVLLEKFSLLLNEKKLKIREQQKLLFSSTADPTNATAESDNNMDVDAPQEEEKPTKKAGPSRPRKRKAPTAVRATAEAPSDSEDGFEKMDVEKPGTTTTVAGQSEEEDNGSDKADERTASETESDDDDDGGDDEKVDAPPKIPKKKSPGPPPPSRRTRAQTAELDEGPKTPPRRELPFATKPQKQKTPPPPSNAGGGFGGSETESDDEL